MTHSEHILVFDFDGVLCDSLHDSIRMAINTYIQLVPKHTLPVNGYLDPDDVEPFEKTNPEFLTLFRQLMPMGNFAEDYFVFLRILETGISETVDRQKRFDAFKRTLSSDALNAYQSLFYTLRGRLQSEDPKTWAQMLPPFPGIPETVRSLSRRFLCAIATSKDIRSVDILLARYKLADIFPLERILDKDFAHSKREHLIRFQKDHNVPFGQIHFIDDKLLHLQSVKDLDVKTYLATWGFNTPREHQAARADGIRLLRLEDLPHLAPSSRTIS